MKVVRQHLVLISRLSQQVSRNSVLLFGLSYTVLLADGRTDRHDESNRQFPKLFFRSVSEVSIYFNLHKVVKLNLKVSRSLRVRNFRRKNFRTYSTDMFMNHHDIILYLRNNGRKGYSRDRKRFLGELQLERAYNVQLGIV